MKIFLALFAMWMIGVILLPFAAIAVIGVILYDWRNAYRYNPDLETYS